MSDDVRPYSGVRIIDLTHDLGRYATRLFADLGAEVIRVEPPGGLPDARPGMLARPGGEEAFVFFNASKRRLTLDLSAPDGRDRLGDLVAGAAIVFIERGGPLGPGDLDWLRARNPALVVTFVSPYGLGGPLEAAPASDLTLQAAGGIAWMSGEGGEPPLRLPAGQPAMIASVYAAVATALCLWDAETRGNGHVLDVSAQECIAHSLQNAVQVWDLERRVSHRAGEGTRDASENIHACADGYVYLAATITTGTTWRALVAWMKETGHPAGEAFSEPKWLDPQFRITRPALDEFKAVFETFSRGFTRTEMLEQAIRRRIILAPVARVGDVLGNAQLDWRGFFRSAPAMEPGFPGAPYRLSEKVWNATPMTEIGMGDLQ